MKQFKKLSALSQRVLCCSVALTIVVLSCFGVLQLVSFADGLQNPDVLTAGDDHTLFKDDFDDQSLNKDWERQQTADGYDCSEQDGCVNFVKANQVRSAIWLKDSKYQALNQRASIEFTSTTGQKQALWLRFGSYSDQTARTGSFSRGYYAQYACGGQEIFVYRWVNINGQNVVNDVIGSFGWNNSIANGTKCRLEMVASGSNPTLLTVRIYTYDSATSLWKMPFSNSYVDNTPELQVAGTSAVAGNGSANVKIDSFEYSSTDKVSGNYYIQKTSECKQGVYMTFGQVVTLQPGKEYVFSSHYKTATNQATLWIEYSADASGKINNNTRMLTNIDNCTKGVSGGYNTLSYSFKLPATGVESNNNWCWYENGKKVGRGRVIVGFRIDGSVKVGTFSHFELYAKDDPNKTNLLVNPDFKMGLYGWDDNFGVSSYSYWYPCKESQLSSNNGRVEVIAATDEEYKGIFGVPEEREPLTFLPNTYYKLTNTKELTIGYVGGSVTSGYGASDQDATSWRGLTTKWFKEKFPDAKVSGFNAAIGSTGSYSAVFRYQREVAPKSPDLLFIEFAVNDYYDELTYNQSLRDAESIVRRAYDDNPYIEIVVVLTADKWCRASEYDCYRGLKDIADAYDLMCIDIRKDFLLTLSDLEYVGYMRNSTDGVHPNDVGYGKYFELIEKKLSRDILLDKPQTVEFSMKKLPLSNVCSEPLMLNADSVRPDEIKMETNSGWTVKNTAFSSLNSRGYSKILTASTPGSEFTFKFNGTDVGLFINKDTDCGKISVTVDSGMPVIIDSYKSSQTHGIAVCGWNLSEQQHTVKVKLLSEKNADSTNTKFTIGAILLNTTPTTDSSNNYMVQNMGTRDYGKFGQVFELDKNGNYAYTVSYKYLNQKGSQPIIMYKTSSASAFTQLTTFTSTEDDLLYRTTYNFTIPEDAYDIGSGKAQIMVGYTLGQKNSNGYFYNFELFDLSDNTKTNMFVNPLFKEGFKGWTGDAFGYKPITAEGELTYNSGEAKLKVADESLFKKNVLTGQYMVHNTGRTTYMKFGQLFEVEPGTSYVFTCKVKYINTASCAPIAMYFRKTAPTTHVTIPWDSATDDKDHSSFTGTFTVPDDANVLANGKVEMFVGYTTGAEGADVYFADFNVYKSDDENKTNMYTNVDFKYGLMNWRNNSRGTPVSEYGLMTFSDNSAELLPYDPSLFTNDSNDHFVDDGDWYSVFGADESTGAWMKRSGAYYEKTGSIEEDGEWITSTEQIWHEPTGTEIEESVETNVDVEKAPKRVLKKKLVKKTVKEADYTVWIVLGIIVVVLAVALVTFLLYKKSKKAKKI